MQHSPLASPDSPDRKMLTMWVCGIQDSARLTDEMEPEDLTCVMNDHLSEMSNTAQGNGATVDKVSRNAWRFFFGCRETRCGREDAQQGARMAVLQQRNSVFNQTSHPWVGVNTGFCNVGNFGSDRRMDYNSLEDQARDDAIQVQRHAIGTLVEEGGA